MMKIGIELQHLEYYSVNTYTRILLQYMHSFTVINSNIQSKFAKFNKFAIHERIVSAETNVKHLFIRYLVN